jgi:hypothetical protein
MEAISRAFSDLYAAIESGVAPEYRASVLLVEGFHFISCGGRPGYGLEEVIAELKKCRLESWQAYLVRLLEVYLGTQKKVTKAEQMKVINWLIAHHEVLTKNAKQPEMRDIVEDAACGERGPVLASLYVGKAVLFDEDGRDADAKDLYEKVISEYPNTGWAETSRTLLNSMAIRKQDREKERQKKRQLER